MSTDTFICDFNCCLQDLEFVVANKVTHVLNCAGKEIPNHWEPIGVVYLTLNWFDSENQIIFGSHIGKIDEHGVQQPSEEDRIFDFIDSALTKGESVLVHSLRG